MKIIEKGYIYEVSNFENSKSSQTIRFICKEQRGDEFVTVHDGTTNEELLLVLVNRLSYLNSIQSCVENEIAINSLKSALYALEIRNRDRKRRKVEETPLP